MWLSSGVSSLAVISDIAIAENVVSAIGA